MDNAGKKPVWSVQPPKGMLKGDYYRIEERFPPYYPGVEGEFPADPGHLGIVEAVKADGKLIFVELNEITAPSYYNHLYQGISKRPRLHAAHKRFLRNQHQAYNCQHDYQKHSSHHAQEMIQKIGKGTSQHPAPGLGIRAHLIKQRNGILLHRRHLPPDQLQHHPN